MASRRISREEALQLLYSCEVTGNPLDSVLDDPSILHDDDSPYDPFTKQLTEKAFNVSGDCDAIIESHARNWSLGRIAILDRLILRIAITEFLHFPDIHP